jgi:DNA polymerase III gamma/tau subunit
LQSLEYVTLEDVRVRVGESGFEYVETIMHAIQAGDRETLLKTVRRMEEVGVPLDHFVRLLLSRVREDVHRAVEQKRTTKDLERMLNVLLEAVRDVRIAPVPGLVLESALLSLCGDVASPPEAKRPAPSIPHVTPPPAPPAPKHTPSSLTASTTEKPTAASVPATPPTTSASVSLQEVRQIWPEVIQEVEPAAARMSLKNGLLHAVEDSAIVVSFGSSFHKEKASSPEVTHAIEQSLRKRLGSPMTFKAVLENDASVFVPSPRTDANPPGDMVDLANAAAEIF